MPKAIPPGGPCTPLYLSLTLSIPWHDAPLPRRGRISQHRFQRGEPLAYHLGLASFAALINWGERSMQNTIKPTWGDRRDPAASCMHTQFQAAVGGITHHTDG